MAYATTWSNDHPALALYHENSELFGEFQEHKLNHQMQDSYIDKIKRFDKLVSQLYKHQNVWHSWQP